MRQRPSKSSTSRENQGLTGKNHQVRRMSRVQGTSQEVEHWNCEADSQTRTANIHRGKWSGWDARPVSQSNRYTCFALSQKPTRKKRCPQERCTENGQRPDATPVDDCIKTNQRSRQGTMLARIKPGKIQGNVNRDGMALKRQARGKELGKSNAAIETVRKGGARPVSQSNRYTCFALSRQPT